MRQKYILVFLLILLASTAASLNAQQFPEDFYMDNYFEIYGSDESNVYDATTTGEHFRNYYLQVFDSYYLDGWFYLGDFESFYLLFELENRLQVLLQPDNATGSQMNANIEEMFKFRPILYFGDAAELSFSLFNKLVIKAVGGFQSDLLELAAYCKIKVPSVVDIGLEAKSAYIINYNDHTDIILTPKVEAGSPGWDEWHLTRGLYDFGLNWYLRESFPLSFAAEQFVTGQGLKSISSISEGRIYWDIMRTLGRKAFRLGILAKGKLTWEHPIPYGQPEEFTISSESQAGFYWEVPNFWVELSANMTTLVKYRNGEQVSLNQSDNSLKLGPQVTLGFKFTGFETGFTYKGSLEIAAADRADIKAWKNEFKAFIKLIFPKGKDS